MKPLTKEIEFNHIFRVGMVRQAEIQQKIAGRIISKWPWDGGVLTYFLSVAGMGDHIEIGTAWGGTAILAAMANPHPTRHVYTIDPLENPPGFSRIDSYIIRQNFKVLRFSHMITFYHQRHPPLPAELEDKRFATAFIDGSHFYDDVLADWENLRGRVDEFIIFHDVNGNAVQKVFRMAQEDPDWELAYEYDYMGVVRHV